MIARGNTQVVLSKEDNRRLRMMAAQEGVSTKLFLSELIRAEWNLSSLSLLDKENASEEEVQATSSADVGEDA